VLKALVVEDEFTARCVLARFLSRHGECDVAVDGAEAVRALEAALRQASPYQLVCLDIGLPYLGGQGVLEKLRALEQDVGVQLGHGSRVIMTTASATKEDVTGAFRGGADGYLTKPVNLTSLTQLLRNLKLVP
jgi:two-component system chemotaxis response regulator CheY